MDAWVKSPVKPAHDGVSNVSGFHRSPFSTSVTRTFWLQTEFPKS
jgi:hypothetical protein